MSKYTRRRVFGFYSCYATLLKAKNVEKSKGIIHGDYSQIDIREQRENIYVSPKTSYSLRARKDACNKIPLVLSEFCQEQRQLCVSRQQLRIH